MRTKTRLLISVGATILALCWSCTVVPHTQKIDGPDSVSSLEYIAIGGVRHLFLIRGSDVSRPILLFLHGGPGMPGIPLEHAMRNLENDFVLVFYDQRGTGKSEPRSIEPAGIDRYVADAEEVVRMLLLRFRKERLYLVGHSWGSDLGLQVARDILELLYAYIGVGQVINGIEQERTSYRYVVNRATELKNDRCLAAMAGIHPPYLDETGKLRMEDLALERKWLEKMGGVWFDYRAFSNRDLMKTMIDCTEYTLFDFRNVERRAKAATVSTWSDQMSIDFFTQIPRLDVPLYFFEGRADYNVPFELAYAYYETVEALKGKRFVWFDRSGHVPFLEESDKFREELLLGVSETYR